MSKYLGVDVYHNMDIETLTICNPSLAHTTMQSFIMGNEKAVHAPIDCAIRLKADKNREELDDQFV